MKAIIISIIAILGFNSSIFPQNRICGWETEKISAVHVEYRCHGVASGTITIDDLACMDEILNYLSKNLIKYKLPKNIFAIRKIPFSQLGKPLKSEIKKIISADFL